MRNGVHGAVVAKVELEMDEEEEEEEAEMEGAYPSGSDVVQDGEFEQIGDGG